MQNRKIQLWALSITGYNCKIQYVKGTRNVCADLLSRSKGTLSTIQDKEVDIDDRAYEVSAINSNRLEPRRFAKLNEGSRADDFEMPTLANFDMVREQDDKEIRELKKGPKKEKATKAEKKKFIILDEVVYYISHPDEDPTVRLYIPTHLRPRVLVQYHDENGHMGADMTYQAIRIKYFWPCLFREVVGYVNECVTC